MIVNLENNVDKGLQKQLRFERWCNYWQNNSLDESIPNEQTTIYSLNEEFLKYSEYYLKIFSEVIAESSNFVVWGRPKELCAFFKAATIFNFSFDCIYSRTQIFELDDPDWSEKDNMRECGFSIMFGFIQDIIGNFKQLLLAQKIDSLRQEYKERVERFLKFKDFEKRIEYYDSLKIFPEYVLHFNLSRTSRTEGLNKN